MSQIRRDTKIEVISWHLVAAAQSARLQARSFKTKRYRYGGRRRPASIAGRKPVWHCSLHKHADDALLSDQRWAQVAAQFMAGVGLAPHGDLRAVRWLGIRHGDDHVHLVATLVLQDGRTVWAWNDYRSAQAAARQLEDRYGLHRVGQDRAAP